MTAPSGAQSDADRILGPMPIPPAVSADDAKWLSLCVFEEAQGECQDGKAAVAKVVLNRTRRHPPYASIGTIKSTVFWPNQFSWTSWSMLGGHYIKVARTAEDVQARALKLLAEAIANKLVWAACEDAALDVLAGTYEGGDGYRALGPDALLYVNLAAVARPAWADPAKLISKVGRHSFFRP